MGLFSAWLYRRLPDLRGGGVDRVLLAYHLGQGRLPPRLGPLKALLTALTLGLGGSGGQEGPLLYAGGALAQALRPRNPAEARAVLLAGGVAAIAALFHTPLGAAFFAAEVLYRGSALEGRLLGYLAVAAISGYGLQSLFFGTRPLLPVQGLEAPPLWFALALAPLAALGAWALVSAAARTPFAAVVQMVEITGSYALLVPGLLVAFGAFALNRETLFPLQPSGPEASPAHAEDLRPAPPGPAPPPRGPGGGPPRGAGGAHLGGEAPQGHRPSPRDPGGPRLPPSPPPRPPGAGPAGARGPGPPPRASGGGGPLRRPVLIRAGASPHGAASDLDHLEAPEPVGGGGELQGAHPGELGGLLQGEEVLHPEEGPLHQGLKRRPPVGQPP